MSCSLSYRLDLKCVPREDLFRTKPGVKSTQVRSVRLRIEPDNTRLVASLGQAMQQPYHREWNERAIASLHFYCHSVYL